MARSVFIAVLVLGAIDLSTAEQPELNEQKPQYTRTRELPALKISLTDMQFALEKAANLLSDTNRDGGKKPKDIFLRETLRLGTGPDEIEVAGHSFPANAYVPKAAYALSYSYSWTDAPVSRLQLDLGDYTRRLSVSGTAVDQVEAISAALERDLSQNSAIGGDMVRTVGGGLLFLILVMSLLMSGSFCFVERQWRLLGMPIFSLVGLVLLFTLPFRDIFAGFAVYQGETSWIVRFEPQMAFLAFPLTIASIALSFLIPVWRDARKENLSSSPGIDADRPSPPNSK
jgi:hypothetical protein